MEVRCDHQERRHSQFDAALMREDLLTHDRAGVRNATKRIWKLVATTKHRINGTNTPEHVVKDRFELPSMMMLVPWPSKYIERTQRK